MRWNNFIVRLIPIVAMVTSSGFTCYRKVDCDNPPPRYFRFIYEIQTSGKNPVEFPKTIKSSEVTAVDVTKSPTACKGHRVYTADIFIASEQKVISQRTFVRQHQNVISVVVEQEPKCHSKRNWGVYHDPTLNEAEVFSNKLFVELTRQSGIIGTIPGVTRYLG